MNALRDAAVRRSWESRRHVHTSSVYAAMRIAVANRLDFPALPSTRRLREVASAEGSALGLNRRNRTVTTLDGLLAPRA